jgi:Ca2+-binding RTX toxin-like protein
MREDEGGGHDILVHVAAKGFRSDLQTDAMPDGVGDLTLDMPQPRHGSISVYTGNGLDNRMEGTDVADVLDGGKGDDVLVGGLGPDELSEGPAGTVSRAASATTSTWWTRATR